MKILVTSDWHLDYMTFGKRRFDEIRSLIKYTVDYTMEYNFDMYVMLGDLCNPNNVRSHRSISSVIELMNPIKDKSVFITGNHDVIEDGSGDHTMLALKSSGVQVIDQPEVWSYTDINFIFLPYTPYSHNYSPEEYINGLDLSLDRNIKNIVFSHLNIEGIVPGSEVTDMPRGRDIYLPINQFPNNTIIFNGHYHKQQIYRNVHIPGSLVRLSFNEINNKPAFLTYG